MAVAILAKSRKRCSNPKLTVHKPHGVLHPRVQKVGPERFGIVSVDCAKAQSKWMLCDFYGTVLQSPTLLPHTQGHFASAATLLREAPGVVAAYDGEGRLVSRMAGVGSAEPHLLDLAAAN